MAEYPQPHARTLSRPRRPRFRSVGARDALLFILIALAAGVYLLGSRYAESLRLGFASAGRSNSGASGLAGDPAFVPTDRAARSDRRTMAAFAAGRTGYVVWESRQPSGTPELKYRIWKRNLDGSNLAMISGEPARPGYAHMGPRIAPDGSHVIFAGKEWNSSTAGPGELASYGSAYAAPPFDAWILDIDPVTLEPGTPRELLSVHGQLGSAGVNRFFEWKDSRTVYVNLPAQRGIFELDVFADQVGAKVVGNVRDELLAAPDASRTFCAAAGGVALRSLESAGPVCSLGPRLALPGCQAMPDSTGSFVVWVRSPGRIAALDLAHAATPPDGAPPGRDLDLGERISRAYPAYDYCYFPAVCRDGSLIACAASRIPPGMPADRYDLKRCPKSADFEIFLIRFDRTALQPVGQPVRYSYNDHAAYPYLFDAPDPEAMMRRGHALDRFPDVWVRNDPFERDRLAARAASARQTSDPAASLLNQAASLESVDPRRALELYGRTAREHPGSAPALQAARRSAELAHDPDFQAELSAQALLEQLRRAEASFRASAAAAPQDHAALAASPSHPADPSQVETIRAAYAELLKNYPATRATLEARSLVRRCGIDVPKELPANRRTVAEVEAVATLVSAPLPLKAVYPYTQAFLTARLQIRKVLSGELKGRDIVVVLMSMDDGKNLPAARLKPGEPCRLRLGLWADQVHFHSHKISDDVMDLDAVLYFALDAAPVLRPVAGPVPLAISVSAASSAPPSPR